MRLVWRAIGGAEEGSMGGGVRLLEAACATALHYADLVHGALADQGYYENNGEKNLLFSLPSKRQPVGMHIFVKQ